jgi:hypothetical protein
MGSRTAWPQPFPDLSALPKRPVEHFSRMEQIASLRAVERSAVPQPLPGKGGNYRACQVRPSVRLKC